MPEVAEKAAATSLVVLPVLAETQVKPADLVPLAKFDDEKRRRIATIEASVTITDSNSIEGFAVPPQRKLSDFLDKLLVGIKAGDLGEAGQLTAELARNVKCLDLPGLKKEAAGQGGLHSLPVVGGWFSAFSRLRAMHEQIVTQLAAVESKATVYMGTLKAGTAALDSLLDATEDNLRELELWLAGGQQALVRMRQQFQDEYAVLKDQGASADPIRLAHLRDMAEQINAFETRLVRLHMAFSRGMLAVPQIRTTQSAGRIEFQNTLDTVLTDIPDIKRAIIQIATVRQIAKATASSEQRRELRRQLGTLAADALDEAYTNAKATQGDMATDIADLETLTNKTLATIEKGARMDVENREKRQVAMQQIGEVRQRLMEGLRSNSALSANHV